MPSLTAIPSGLFDYNTKVERFSSAFRDDTSITGIPSGLFDNCTGVTSYTNCFDEIGTGLLGDAPALWDLVPEPIGTDCFDGATNLTNYAAIPADWK